MDRGVDMVDFGDRSLSHQTFLQVVWILLDVHANYSFLTP